MQENHHNEELPDQLLKAVEVARVLNISRAFAYQLMNQGTIPTVKLGAARRVRSQDLYAYIEQSVRSDSAK